MKEVQRRAAAAGTLAKSPAPSPEYTLRGHLEAVQCVRFLDTSLLASGDLGGEAMLWDLDIKRPLHRWQASDESILEIQGHKDGSALLTQSRDGLIRMWDMERLLAGAHSEIREIPTDAFHFSRMAVAMETFVSSRDHSPDKDQIEPTSTSKDIKNKKNSLLAQALHPEDDNSNATTADPGIEVDSDDDEAYFKKESTNPALQGPNSSLLLAPCDPPEAMALWDTRSRSYAMKLEHGADSDLKVGMVMTAKLWVPEAGNRSAWAPPVALLGHESGHLYLWDLRRMRPRMLFSKQLFQAPVMAFDLTRDARRLFAAAVEPNARVFNLDLYKNKITSCSPPLPATCQTVLHNHTGIGHLALRPDAKLFATAGWDFRIRLFANKSPHFKPLAILRYHDATVNALDFSPDSQLLAAGSKDSKISVWSGLFTSASKI